MPFRAENFVTAKIQELYRGIVAHVGELQQLSHLQPLIMELYDNPRLRLFDRDLSQAASRLEKAGLIENAAELEDYRRMIAGQNRPISLLSAPGSKMNHHHAYPGGWIHHVAADLEHALATLAVYQKIYGVTADREVVIATMAVHDIAKPMVYLWDDEGGYPPEIRVAGTSGHHLFSAAEAILRGFPFPVVKAMAACHMTPDAAEEQMDGFLTAAYRLAGEEPPALGNYQLAIEDWICSYSDGDGDILAWMRGQADKNETFQALGREAGYVRLAAESDIGVYQRVMKV